ncbi:MAG: hypothetical protein HY718_10095 [Planctomycetes bacterium]|nr:hypothetical protein [Planctomycetota bacterium]
MSSDLRNPVVPGPVSVVLLALVGIAALVGTAGCDETAGGLIDPANIASWGGLVNPWYTSALGLPAYPTTYYDPTNVIQGVAQYRSDTMEAVANDFSDFIMQ